MVPGTLIDEDESNQILEQPLSADLKIKIPTVFQANLITKDFDALRFQAAASLQLRHEKSNLSQAPTDHLLISSPYNELDHLLDLRTLDIQDRLFAKALTTLQPVRPDYATTDYIESFNWDHVLKTLRLLAKEENHVWTRQAFYTVIFRSKLRENIDRQLLHDLDQHSHREATVSGGLLKYWFGAKDEKEQNLATCIWRERDDARKGGLGPWHAKARMAARELYVHINFTMCSLVIEDGATGLRID